MRTDAAKAASSRPTEAPFFWTKSEKCPSDCRQNSCGPFSREKSSGSVQTAASTWMCVSSRLPTGISEKKWPTTISGKTFISASTSSPLRSPLCVSAQMTFPCWQHTFSPISRSVTARTSRASLPRPWIRCCTIPGRATCASSKTPWNAHF